MTQRLRPLSRRLNPLMGRLVVHIPGFAIIGYRGRKTGQAYRTPLNAFRRDGDFLFALPYGAGVDWVQNVLAAGTARLEVGGRVIELRDPRRFSDSKASLIPLPMRLLYRLLRVSEFLRMSPAESAAPTADDART